MLFYFSSDIPFATLALRKEREVHIYLDAHFLDILSNRR
jgi:hypothetical protein